MNVFQKYRVSRKLAVAVVFTVLVGGILLLLASFSQREKTRAVAASTATAKMWVTEIAIAQATSIAEVRDTVTVQIQSTATAQEIINASATNHAQSTATAQVKAASTVQVQATDTAIAQKTTIAEDRSTAIALAQTRTTSNIRKTVTAQIQATYVASLYKDATATVRAKATATAKSNATSTADTQKEIVSQAQATSTAQRRGTATTQAWMTAIAATQSKTIAQIEATVTAIANTTATAQAQEGTWLIIAIERVTVFADKADGLDGDIEFLMRMKTWDGRNSISLSYPPEGGAIDVLPGRPIQTGRYALAIDESQLGDELMVYFVALDVDDQSLDESIPWDLFEAVLQTSFYKFVNRYQKILDIRLPGIDGLVEWVHDYFNLLGEGTLILRRTQNWQADKVIKYTSEDFGVEVVYHNHLLNKRPTTIIKQNSH